MNGRTAHGDPMLVKADLWASGLGITNSGGLFMATQPGTREIYLARLDSGIAGPVSERTVDVVVGNPFHPAWSPDGRYLAYVGGQDAGHLAERLGIIDVTTGAVREITPSMDRFRRPRWARDGRSVVVQGVDVNARQGLYRIDVETAAVTPLVTAVAPETLSWPELSPDGSRLFFVRRSTGACGVFERDLQQGQERRVTTCDRPGPVAISPDGMQIAQARAIGGSQYLDAVVVEPVAGGPARQIYRQPAVEYDINSVSWMPDGSHVVVVRNKAVSPDQREALMVPVAGGPPTRLELPPTVADRIDVHPDGRQLAFVAGEQRQEVWVLENFLPPASKPAKK